MKLPITKESFEEIVSLATESQGLPVDDNMRVMAISYLHSLDRFIIDFDLEQLGQYLFKAVSNDMTYHIGQDIHKKRQEEAAAKLKAAALEAAESSESPTLTVV